MTTPTILNEEVILDGFFKVVQATCQDKTGTYRRLSLERGDSVAVLFVEQGTQDAVFVRQWRYPLHHKMYDAIMEIPAGRVEKNESHVDAFLREVQEEIGYDVTYNEKIGEYFMSPGGCSEKIHIYYAEGVKTSNGGGRLDENEQIEVVKIDLNKLCNLLDRSFDYIVDAKTIIALQWWKLNKGLK